jgi:Ca-activated chloride channel homolog
MKLTRSIILAAVAVAASSWAAAPVVPVTRAVSLQTSPVLAIAPPPLLRISDTTAQPVRLAAVKVDGRVVGRLVRTTVELSFRNPNGRVLEGELQMPLLDGQQITGFALDFDGKWRNAVPVDKAKGQQVFEDVTRSRVDPALLEATQGNNFKLRIYPIPANGQRRVLLTIAERLSLGRDGKAVLRLPVPTGDVLESFEVHLAVPGLALSQVQALRGLSGAAWRADEEGVRVDFQRRDYQSEKLLEIAIDPPTKPVAVVEELAGQRYFYAELAMPKFAKALRPKPARLALVWDASGSGAARDHGREFALLDSYFKHIGDTQVNLVLARDRAEMASSYRIHGGDWSTLRTVLEHVAYDGATNPAAFQPMAPADAVLLFSDGLGNFGATAMPAFTVPLLAVSASASADVPRLRHAAETSGGTLVDLTRTAPEMAAQLLREAPPRLVGLRSNSASQLVASLPDSEGRVAVAGVLSETEAAVDLLWQTPSGGRDSQVVKLVGGRTVAGVAAQQWARLRVESLEPEYALNKAEIQRLGKGFGLVTRATSLIVLDRVEDYVRYDILPPSELRADFDRLRGTQRQQLLKDKVAHLEDIARRFKEKQAWWDKDFPKGNLPKAKEELKAALAEGVAEGRAALDRSRAEPRPMVAPAPVAAPAPMMAGAASVPAAKMASADSSTAGSAAPAAIQLRKWRPDAPYADRLRKAAQENLYRVYLDERSGYLDSTAFFLDAADIFFDRGEPQLALRILSNLAEMNLENRHILRILGYRLIQAKQPALAVAVLERVLDLAPDEPQSYRDLGLAQAEAGQRQQAVEHLYEVVTRPWHGRFPDIELVALAELNALVATAPAALDTSAIDTRLLRNLPLDLRAVLTWDADNTDIDLWVTDPNGEKVFYGHTLSYQGGSISRDFTGGYGPEEFSLKIAKPGKYLVQAQFYGHRQQVVSGATTLQLHLFTGFGTAQQRDQSVTLRLKSGGEVVTVGEFVVGEKSANKASVGNLPNI